MNRAPVVTQVRFTRATAHEVRSGLLGYVRAHYGYVVLDGITVRRLANGGLALAWPVRRDRMGRNHALIRPLDDAARQSLEHAVFAQIELDEKERSAARCGGGEHKGQELGET